MFCRKTRAHLPSGENAFAEPCPKRTADAPFVSRLKTAYSPPPASPASMNSTSFASSEMSTGTVQSCQLRSRSLFSPGARPIAPERIASREIRARPLVLASCSVSVPGALSNSRSLPDKLTPRSERLNPVAVAVNQTSSPEGDQAKPQSAGPALGQVRLLAAKVDHANRSPVIAQEIVIDKSQVIALGRETQIADPSSGFMQYFANRVFQAALATDDVHNSQAVAVWSPVGIFDVIQQVTGSIRTDR